MKRIILSILLFITAISSCDSQQYMPYSQTDPRPYSVFNDVAGRWRADTYTTPGSYSFTDLSGNNNHMVQQAGTLTPGTAANGQAKFTGNASARLTSALTIKSWPVTIITFGKRTGTTTCGMFGHTGATGYNTLWTGYDGTNSFMVYNTSSAANTTSGTNDTCWLVRLGYGSRITIIDGLIQSDMTVPSILQSGEISTTLGTEYRGLNMDWQETMVWERELSLEDIDEIHAYINQRYGKSIPLWSSYTEAPVVVISGQSNAASRATRGVSDANVPVEYQGNQTNVAIWDGSAWSTPFNLSNNDNMLGESGGVYFGMETVMGKEYIDRVGGSVYIMKYAKGNTEMAYSPGNDYWGPDNNTAPNNGNRLYTSLLTEWWQSVREHQIASRKPVLKGFTEYQGENDAADATFAAAYQTNASNFYNRSRAEFATSSTAPIFICRIHADITETYKTEVRTAQENLATTLINCTLVSVDGYGLIDSVHIGGAGQIALATYIAGLLD